MTHTPHLNSTLRYLLIYLRLTTQISWKKKKNNPKNNDSMQVRKKEEEEDREKTDCGLAFNTGNT